MDLDTMNLPLKITVQGKGPLTLDKNSYVAAGGEGTVCREGNTAYKIYHDPHRMIPLKKITELQPLSSLKNVFGPRNIIFDAKHRKAIGFTMPYEPHTEFLCRLFSKNFRQSHNITAEKICTLVERMQKTIEEIHKNGILLVDLNEMNFLTDADYTEPLFIDVDSYQTPSFKATALMETVRDRTTKPGCFSEETDWFSFAVVSFQLYMGYHPYQKGKHPDYKPMDWSKRMDKNISVFHPDVSLASVWKDFSCVPQTHLEWYKRVFQNSERSKPPVPGSITAVMISQPVTMKEDSKLKIEELFCIGESIRKHYHLDGKDYFVTRERIYRGYNLIAHKKTDKELFLVNASGQAPVIGIDEGKSIRFESNFGTVLATIPSEAQMCCNGNLYSLHNGRMYENSFASFGSRTIHVQKEIAQVFRSATRLYEGVAVQDILRTCWMAIPFETQRCVNIHIPQLDGRRILSAKYENGKCITVSEYHGRYLRHIFIFNEDHTSYDYAELEEDGFGEVNFTVLQNGVCVHAIAEDAIQVFKGLDLVKELIDPLFNTGNPLSTDGINVFFIQDNKFYKVSMP